MAENPYEPPQSPVIPGLLRPHTRTSIVTAAVLIATLVALLDAGHIYLCHPQGLDTRTPLGSAMFLIISLMRCPGLPLFLVLDDCALLPAGENDDLQRGIIALACNWLSMIPLFIGLGLWTTRRQTSVQQMGKK